MSDTKKIVVREFKDTVIQAPGGKIYPPNEVITVPTHIADSLVERELADIYDEAWKNKAMLKEDDRLSDAAIKLLIKENPDASPIELQKLAGKAADGKVKAHFNTIKKNMRELKDEAEGDEEEKSTEE